MDEREELLNLNKKLLDSIAGADWATYVELCDPSLTAFEPESLGHLVEGMEFHRFYFDGEAAKGRRQTTMASPHVRLLGDTAVVSYIRLIQKEEGDDPLTVAFEETRIWHKRGGQWRHVHFHRSNIK